MEKNAGFALEDSLIAEYTVKLKKWFALLKDVMPNYFFTTFTTGQIQEIVPALLNLSRNAGIQEIRGENYVILIYLKSDSCNLVTTARRMREFNIAGAAIHESVQKIVINNEPSTLVIEYYDVREGLMKNPPAFTIGELRSAYKKRFGAVDPGLDEIYGRLNWSAVADLDLDRLAERLNHALKAQKDDKIHLDVEKSGKDEIRLTMSLSNCPLRGFYCKYIECLARNGFEVRRAYLRRITTQDDPGNMTRMPVSVNTLYLKCDSRNISLNSNKMKSLLAELPHVKWVSCDDLLHRELIQGKGWSMAETNFVRAAGEFIHSQLSYVDRHAYSCQEIFRLMALYEPLLRELFRIFDSSFNPGLKHASLAARKEKEKRIRSMVDSINTGNHEKDLLIKTVFRSLINFVCGIVKTNYYVEDKTALSFRLDPSFMDFYREISARYRESFLERPFGVFFFYRSDAQGFHLRFADIARGGWRTVIPGDAARELERTDAHAFAKDEIFKEVFVLAHTQHMKNKDIYEGGAKMICLLDLKNRQFLPVLYEMQRSICRSFMDLINYGESGVLKNPMLTDLAGRPEIIEIGPDENMHDVMIEWMASFAEENSYCLGGGLISGKSDSGINHKEFGVTSLGVHQYLLKTLEEMRINPEKDRFSIKMSGGPAGDVAGNALKLLLVRNGDKYLYPNLRIVAITDGPAAIFDPDGIDKEALLQLVHRSGLDAFPPNKLSGEGAYIIFTAPVIESGTERYRIFSRHGRIAERMIGRDEFMKIYQENILVNRADVFMPCGGRPETINSTNWQTFIPEGKPSSKAIIEGANSFITPEARCKLQEHGVWIIKDASANKCGVITSSYEILSGLILNKKEFQEKKKQLVSEIMEILRIRARKEADWLFHQFRNTGKNMTELTERLSREINAKNEEISAYIGKHPELLENHRILLRHLPQTFSKMDPERLRRIPRQYQAAIISVELAVRIVYSHAKSLEDEISATIKNM